MQSKIGKVGELNNNLKYIHEIGIGTKEKNWANNKRLSHSPNTSPLFWEQHLHLIEELLAELQTDDLGDASCHASNIMEKASLRPWTHGQKQKGADVDLSLVSAEASPILAFTRSLDRGDLFGTERVGWVLLVVTKRILLMAEGGWNASNTPSHNRLGNWSAKSCLTYPGDKGTR